MNTRTQLSILIVMVLIGGLTAAFYPRYLSVVTAPSACTLEALICPDGTSVGRSGPQCQFAPCPSAPVSSPVASDTNEIGIGQTRVIDGLSITLNNVVQDNRCPRDVTCIVAGAVSADITLKNGGHSETRTLVSDKKPYQFDTYIVSMEKIVPARTVSSAPDPTSYKITFTVEKTIVSTTPTFSGTISAYDTGCFVDAICSVTIDGKVIIIASGRRSSEPVGSLLGVASIGDLDTKIGATATVYAKEISPKEFSLYGSSAYYIKVH